MPRDDDADRDTAPTPESNFALVNQVLGALPGLWAVKCADRVNLASRPEADENPVKVTFRCQYQDVDEGIVRKTLGSHVTSARWVMTAPIQMAPARIWSGDRLWACQYCTWGKLKPCW